MYRIFLILLFLFCSFCAKVFAVDILRMKTFTDKDGLSQNTIYYIFQDHQGFMWINAAKWINRYDGKEFRTVWSEKDDGRQIGRILKIAEDEKGFIWFRTSSGHIRYYDPRKETFEEVELGSDISILDAKSDVPNPEPKLSNGKTIPNAKYITDNKGGKWINNGTGVLWSYGKEGKFEPLTLIPSEILSLVKPERYSIYHDSRGIIWITTFGNGLFAIDPDTGELNHFTKKNGLPTNNLHCVTEDRSGEIWVGTDYAGIVRISVSKYPVKVYYPVGEEGNDRSNAVRVIHEDSDNRYWFGTRDGELFVCDSLLQPVSNYRIAGGMPYDMAEDTLGNKWVITRTSNNVMIFPDKGNGTPHTVRLLKEKNQETSANLSSILRDDTGRMWLASLGEGLFLTEKKGSHIYLRNFPMQTASLNNMRGMIQATDGLIWVSTDEGAIAFDPGQVAAGKNEFTNFQFNSNDENSLSNNAVKVIFEDSQKRIWLGTLGSGLNLLVRKAPLLKSTFKRYGAHHGMFNEIVQAIEEDEEGFLWIGTESGMSKFDPRKDHFDNFFFSEDRNANVFNERASWKRRDGKLMFGSYNGVYIFNPAEISYGNYAPPVVITGLWVNGNEVTPEIENSPLSVSISLEKNIRLEHNANSFNLQFAMLNYVNPELNQYTYYLEGYEEDWNPVSLHNIAAYRNVPPGKYVFKVKGCNSFGVWTNVETILQIRILPPWWASWWAMVIYAILLVLAAYFSWRIIMRVNKLKMAIEVEKQVADFKERLFTNVAHEFRTPLTIIRSAVDKLSGESTSNGQTVDSLSRSTNRLSLLTEQLLDFHKAHYNKLELRVSRVEVVSFIHEVFSAFQIIADNKNVNFRFQSGHKEYDMLLDAEKWNKIIYNLLSNAFKYTPANGTIEVELIFSPDKDTFELSVSDSGSGIPEDKQKELFDRFMQVSYDPKGSGLGLNLTGELAVAHKGRITYATSRFGGASFVVSIPLLERNYRDNEIVEEVSFDKYNVMKEEAVDYEPLAESDDGVKYQLLVIEDESEIRMLLDTELGKRFKVYFAENGEEGLKIAVNNQPDLIVCDVMMPGISGYETTKMLKNNFETSHIPVILLTALTSENSQLTGIESGADAYITKPFSLKYLLARINKLIEQRNRLKHKFAQEPGTMRPEISASDVDADFLDNIHREIESNIDNSQFIIDDLIKASGTSRSIFYQKFKTLTGFTPNEYLRVIRLKKAADLLTHTDIRISDIAYKIGFDDPLYFSKSFKAQFGKSPRQYRTNALSDK